VSIYSKKQRWKLWLFIFALVIVGVSLWFTNELVNEIAKEEEQKVKLWAEAVEKKARLVKFTSVFFDTLANEERKKVELWLAALKIGSSNTSNQSNLSLVTLVLEGNTTVPVILTDEQRVPHSWRNVDVDSAWFRYQQQLAKPKPEDTAAIKDSAEFVKFYLTKQIEAMEKQYPPIEVPFADISKNLLFYSNSKIYTTLKTTFKDIQQSFISELVINAASAPVILTDLSRTEVIEYGNVPSKIINDTAALRKKLEFMEEQNPPLEVDLGKDQTNLIFYQDSYLLTQLRLFPFVQFGIIGLFILIAYLLFSTARRSEQNQVWVGMSKETAHQLGTPLSSLMAWVEILRDHLDVSMIDEINKDVKRLETIADRFSKIGSVPNLKDENIQQVIEKMINYLRPRTSDKMVFSIKTETDNTMAKINVPLFEWVIENLCKNAIDAMDGAGSITVLLFEKNNRLYIDITDTGKGMPKSMHKDVFQPGFTTKKRGWGLGLSLTKRIIHNYHKGKIFVKRSEIDKGTTFRIILKR